MYERSKTLVFVSLNSNETNLKINGKFKREKLNK